MKRGVFCIESNWNPEKKRPAVDVVGRKTMSGPKLVSPVKQTESVMAMGPPFNVPSNVSIN